MSGPGILVLVGMMGSGKTAVAKRLATHGVALLDTDQLIEEAGGRTVRAIFEEDGEPVFRALEEEAMARCLAHPGHAVVAAAGGAVTSLRTREALAASRREGTAYVVWLRTGTGELARRVDKSVHRPLLDGNARNTLERLDVERRNLYAEVADAVVDTDGRSVAEVAQLVGETFAAAGGSWGSVRG